MSQLIPPASLADPNYQRLLQQCIHCGLCLPACPTYAVFNSEMDAPRGRIALMRAASAGRISLDGPFEEHISLCLGCRACETACPSGVQYGALLETARAALQRHRRPGIAERFIRWLALHIMLPHTTLLRLTARLLRIYQITGLQRIVSNLHILKRLQMMDALLPPLPAHYPDYHRPAPALGPKRGTVAFFYGCVQDAFLADINAATIRILQHNGYEVHFPRAQTCCGAVALHVGEDALARDLARRNIDAFPYDQYNAIINNAGGCGAALKDYPHLLHDDPTYKESSQQFAAKVQDISEFLADHLHNPPQGRLNIRATYADSCHLRHAQKIVRQPRSLLNVIPGLEFIEMRRPDQCCGSAGVYNIINIDAANAVLDNKMADIAATGADTIVTTNTGCHMQLLYGVRRAGLEARVVHLVELLDQSYAQEQT